MQTLKEMLLIFENVNDKIKEQAVKQNAWVILICVF